MTLIVGFKCGDSVVLCADSQETRGNLKSEINKLPIHMGDGGTDVVCAGAGNGELTDGFRARLEAAIGPSQASDKEMIRREIENALVEFHQSPVFASFPGKDEDKYICGLICVRTRTREVMLFKYFCSVVESVDTYHLAGEDYAHFEHVVRRLFRTGTSVQQAILMGLEVLNTAKATSLFVGGPTRVVVATPSGISVENTRRINAAEAFVQTKIEAFDSLSFDLGSSNVQMQKKVDAFANSITSIRGIYGSKFESWPQSSFGEIEPSDDDS